jgi:hypothetical protein
MKFISADGTTRGRLMGQTVSFEPLRALAPKEKAVWRVTVEALSEGDVRFSAKLTSEMINRPVDETEATNFYK